MGLHTQNYKIIKEIGRGGMGTVYLANDVRLDREVAIKVLHLDSTFDSDTVSEVITRFKKESKAIAQLSHPNIVTIYDVGEEGNQYYMVIELVQGSSLFDIIEKKQKCKPELVLSIGMQVCSALSYAHKKGIVHRDIKPANIMLTEFNIAKLTDFGIAQLNNDNVTLTKAGSILGSILYIPPEQLVDSRNVDQRADLYSLGVTLFQLLTQRLPFEGKQVAEVITKIINDPIPNLRTFDPSIPDILDMSICKALQKNPNERYQTADEFKYTLEKAMEYIKNPNAINSEIHISETTRNSLSNTGENQVPKDTLSSKLEKTIIEKKNQIVDDEEPKQKLEVTKPLDEKILEKDVTPVPQKKQTTKLNQVEPQKKQTTKLNELVIKEKFVEVEANKDDKQKKLILIVIGGVIFLVFILVLILALVFGKGEKNTGDTIETKPSPKSTFIPRIETTPSVKPVVKSSKPKAKPIIKPTQPVKQQPVYKPPVRQQPVYRQPAYKPPVRQQPVYRKPVYKPPVRQQPVYKPPVRQQPVVKPQETKKNFGEGY